MTDEPDLVDYLTTSAVISDDKRFRYTLTRRWALGPTLGWVMLNPSTADADADDPTIRRCVSFSRAAGYGALTVGNLYAYRATDPRELARVPDPIGPDNALALGTLADVVVCAWGASADQWRAAEVAVDLHQSGIALRCLGVTKSGQPRHPLYVRGSTELQTYTPPPLRFASAAGGDDTTEETR